MGTFLDGRYFTLPCLFASVAFVRSRASEAVQRRFVLPIHIGGVLFAAALLFYMGTGVHGQTSLVPFCAILTHARDALIGHRLESRGYS